jgi:hypothetical protein
MKKRIRKDKGHTNIQRISAHARVRGQQRGISESLMLLVAAFGKAEYRRDGAVRYSLDKYELKMIEGLLRNGVQNIDKLKRLKVVQSGSDGVVITCYH